jgi:hypothetical protein
MIVYYRQKVQIILKDKRFNKSVPNFFQLKYIILLNELFYDYPPYLLPINLPF